MRSAIWFVGVPLMLVFWAVTSASAQTPRDTITFAQLKPYILSVPYIDSASGGQRICFPELKKSRSRLARRNLEDLRLAKVAHAGYLRLLQKAIDGVDSSRETILAREWSDRIAQAAQEAAAQLKEASEKIGYSRDCLDLIDIRISQLLARDAAFLAPVLAELDSVLQSDSTAVRCIDCREKFAEWLQEVRGKP